MECNNRAGRSSRPFHLLRSGEVVEGDMDFVGRILAAWQRKERNKTGRMVGRGYGLAEVVATVVVRVQMWTVGMGRRGPRFREVRRMTCVHVS